MSYPSTLQEYRENLSSKRGRRESLYEVLVPDVLCYSADNPTRVNWGICNNKKKHWALACNKKIISFVWDVSNGENELFVTGARCLIMSESIKNIDDTNWIGATGLCLEDIEAAGMTGICYC